MIDESNYEAFLLDYQEGRLHGELLDDLRLFLKNHPHLSDNNNDYATIYLDSDNALVMPEKEMMKRDENGYSLDQIRMLRAIDGDLPADEVRKLEVDLEKRESMRREWIALNSAVVKPDLLIVYPRKKELKRNRRIIPLQIKWLHRVAIAASLLVFIYHYWPESTSYDRIANLSTPQAAHQTRTSPTEIPRKETPKPVVNQKDRQSFAHEKESDADVQVSMTPPAVYMKDTLSVIVSSEATTEQEVSDTALKFFHEEALTAADWDELIDIGTENRVEVPLPEKISSKLIRLVTGVKTSESIIGNDFDKVMSLEAGTVSARYVRTKSR